MLLQDILQLDAQNTNRLDASSNSNYVNILLWKSRRMMLFTR